MTTQQAIARGLGLYVAWEPRLVLRVSAGQFRLWDGFRGTPGFPWKRLSDQNVNLLEQIAGGADWAAFE